MSETIFLSLCFIFKFNLSTEDSAIAHDKYYILISDIEVTEFSHNSILSLSN